MTNKVQLAAEHDVLSEPCPRCGSISVRTVVFELPLEIGATDAAAGTFGDDGPLFDCRECGFEWGELIGDLMR